MSREQTDYYALTDTGRRTRLKRVAIKALESYDLDVVRMRGMTDATNGIFRLDTADGERYAMRVSLGPPVQHSEEEVRAELEWLDDLATKPDIDVPRPIHTRHDGRVVVASDPSVPHERICAIFSWLEGTNLADRLTPATMRAFGAAMARLHLHALTFEPSPTFTTSRYDDPYPYDLPFIVFDEAGDDLLPPRRHRLFKEAWDAVEAAIACLADREPPRLLHGDLHPWNAMVNHGRISVFDFEDMVWGWPVQDIGTTLYYFWSSDEFEDRWTQLREGYETVAPWPDQGGEVATFIAGRTLVMANDVISQPEWQGEAPAIYERGEQRIEAMLSKANRR